MTGSPSGSLPEADTFTEHGEPGRGWQDPPPDALTVGAEFVPLADAWVLADPQELFTVTEHVAEPGCGIEHVPVGPLPLQHPPHLYCSVALPEALAPNSTVHGAPAPGWHEPPPERLTVGGVQLG